MTVKEFMAAYYRVTVWPEDVLWHRDDKILSIIRPRIVCNDGFSISVQGSANHYCSPRENLIDKAYAEVELGFPSVADDLIAYYAEDDEDLTDTVYGLVPIDTVEELIEKHGGIKGYDEEQAERLKKGCDMYSECSW